MQFMVTCWHLSTSLMKGVSAPPQRRAKAQLCALHTHLSVSTSSQVPRHPFEVAAQAPCPLCRPLSSEDLALSFVQPVCLSLFVRQRGVVVRTQALK